MHFWSAIPLGALPNYQTSSDFPEVEKLQLYHFSNAATSRIRDGVEIRWEGGIVRCSLVCLSLIALLHFPSLPREPTRKSSHGLQSLPSPLSHQVLLLPGRPSIGRKRRLRLPDNARNRIGPLYIVYCAHKYRHGEGPWQRPSDFR